MKKTVIYYLCVLVFLLIDIILFAFIGSDVASTFSASSFCFFAMGICYAIFVKFIIEFSKFFRYSSGFSPDEDKKQ